MNPARIEHATRVMNPPPDWEEHAETQHCASLAIRDVIDQDGLPFMVSAWEPTPAELAALNRGETVKLWIVGSSHPVVAITVGDVT